MVAEFHLHGAGSRRQPQQLVPEAYAEQRHAPLQEFADPFAAEGYHDTPFARVFARGDFWRTVLVTPGLFLLPALLYFRRRDVTE